MVLIQLEFLTISCLLCCGKDPDYFTGIRLFIDFNSRSIFMKTEYFVNFTDISVILNVKGNLFTPKDV